MESTEIPESVVVRCPLRRFDLRRAKVCERCQHFAGLTQMLDSPSPSLPFHRAFAVRCAYPADRELQALTRD